MTRKKAQSGFQISPDVTEETRAFMEAVIGKLESTGAVEPCDYGSLRMLMVSYDVCVRASDRMLREGVILKDKHGNETVHPAVGLIKSHWSQVATFMRELGLTIKSRERIKALTPEVDEDNELAKYLRK